MSDREDEQAATETEAVEPAVETVDTEAAETEAAETESVETESTESVAADETAGEAAGLRGRIGGLKPNRRWIAVAVLALGLIGATYEGWLLFAHHQRTAAAAQALEAAEKYTLALTSVDPTAIDKNFTEILDGATGEFKDIYSASSEQLRQLLIDNKASAHGTVIDSAVKSATKNKVEVLLFVDQSVSNKTSPQAQIDRSRIVITMEKVKGRWLAAKVDMP
ncbi:Mce protein [Mycobacterium sp. P7213]|uniref:Mce protein n=1 Tax=Mycobacterium sp. P7213 TaxID=2478465 RepID=UPI000F641CD9|nr:Mce protein [Mycobacterium sp. P7213]